MNRNNNKNRTSGIGARIWTVICLVTVLFLSYVFVVANAIEKFEKQIDGYSDLIKQCHNRSQWRKKINEIVLANGNKIYETRYYVETFCSDCPRRSGSWANEKELREVKNELHTNRLIAETMYNKSWIRFLVTIIVGFLVWRAPFCIANIMHRPERKSVCDNDRIQVGKDV